MNIQAKQLNRFFLLATAPFFGLILALLLGSVRLDWEGQPVKLAAPAELDQQVNQVSTAISDAEETAKYTISTIRKSAALYQKTTSAMAQVVTAARKTSSRPEAIYDRRITSKFGSSPYETVQSDKIRIELYKINPGSYKGYAMKIKLKDPSAMKMAVAADKLGSSETTMQAVKHSGAIAGINAGGFADSGGKRYPLSTTIQNGKYLTGFQPSFKDLSFVGLNQSGKLIGGKFSSQSQLDKLKPLFGATFVPVLLQNGTKTPIPQKWLTSPYRAPRTVIGSYKDDQLLVLVVDGYDENGHSGASLPELQDKLYNLGVQSAYNLDGGGSTSLILGGKVVNKPSDGALRPVPTHFLFFK
ncbi:phosphodiester glycosidase family protein [Paenibacillus sp. YPG26]|uniref:phosphodiester glycosidase family protein n=1 Tax=Paenibacillus sp. YPG26 TaxID=2878915 RepID=UPI00203FA8D5|nr:phosphodiester glycosidase family protein [Paenibacillus sp. YPG26]USB32432.1 phosphodiester glycosidase family protein [Paenibacillus sp. YPG26]